MAQEWMQWSASVYGVHNSRANSDCISKRHAQKLTPASEAYENCGTGSLYRPSYNNKCYDALVTSFLTSPDQGRYITRISERTYTVVEATRYSRIYIRVGRPTVGRSKAITTANTTGDRTNIWRTVKGDRRRTRR